MTDPGSRGHSIVWLSAVVLVLNLPAVVAGTEANPELVDPEGDVNYHPAFQQTRSSTYLDLLAAWISYDNATDSFGFHLKTVSHEGIEDPPDEWTVECLQDFETQGPAAPTGVFSMRHVYRSGGANSSVMWLNEDEPGGEGEPIDHSLQVTYGEPGYASYRISYGAVRFYASSISSISVSCRETATPADYSVGPLTNADSGSASTGVSLTELAANRTNTAGDSDGFSGGPGNRSKSEAADPEGESSGVALVSVTAILVVVVAWVRRRNRDEG